MEVGDRVFSSALKKNGIIVTTRDSSYRDTLGVRIHTTNRLEDSTPHNLNGFLPENKGFWCRESRLTNTPKPIQQHNKVTLLGNMGLHRTIRRITEIDRRLWGDRSDIIINYGIGNHRIPRGIFTLNRKLMCNKLQQCRTFNRYGVSVPPISEVRREGFIQKPYFSFGGNNIFEGDDIRPQPNTYYQKKIDKVREFRAHVFLWSREQNPYIQEKVIEDRTQLCWNMHQGGQFGIVYSPVLGKDELTPELKRDIQELAISAVKAIKYDFGGVDILLGRNGHLSVVEINARCGLRERSMAEVKTRFWELGSLNVRDYVRERWEMR